jgi:hypothetical protein
MMELFIQIRDGQPYQCPIMGGNFRAAFPHIDVNNLPPEFARFVRTPMPMPDGPYRHVVENYVWDNGVVKDNWLFCDMTAEEKADKIAQTISRGKPEGDQWVFDETLCMWVDPAATNAVTEIEVTRV